MELDGEFVKQYKDDKNFHKEATGRSVYMKMNQGKDGVKTDLANLNLRRGLAMAIDKTGMVNTLLANGSKALNGMFPVISCLTQKQKKISANKTAIYSNLINKKLQMPGSKV